MICIWKCSIAVQLGRRLGGIRKKNIDIVLRSILQIPDFSEMIQDEIRFNVTRPSLWISYLYCVQNRIS